MEIKPAKKNLGFDLLTIAKAFGLQSVSKCPSLAAWMAADYTFDALEKHILADTLAAIQHYNEQMNEEELKIRMIAPLFYIAKVDEPDKLMVFYERPLSGTVRTHELAVVTDCMVATPVFNAPDAPYFFLQEYNPSTPLRASRKKGDKKDPEAQMLIAMLLAQAANEEVRPIYGSYVIGTSWKFATLSGNVYCTSPLFEATHADDLHHIACMLRYIRTIAGIEPIKG